MCLCVRHCWVKTCQDFTLCSWRRRDWRQQTSVCLKGNDHSVKQTGSVKVTAGDISVRGGMSWQHQSPQPTPLLHSESATWISWISHTRADLCCLHTPQINVYSLIRLQCAYGILCRKKYSMCIPCLLGEFDAVQSVRDLYKGLCTPECDCLTKEDDVRLWLKVGTIFYMQ